MNIKIPLPAGNQIPAVHRNQVILFTKYSCNCSLQYFIGVKLMAQWFTFRNKFTGLLYALFATVPSELPFHSFTADQNPLNEQLELSEVQEKFCD
jgi:hypothetical protein